MDFPNPQFTAYKIQPSYPHMGALDAEIWTRYIAKYPEAFDSCAYDIPVGAGADFDTTVNQATGGNVSRLYQRRIDVIATDGRVLSVIEVKPRASTASIGQVKGYVTLFQRDYSPQLPVIPLIITDTLLPEMEILAKNERVNLIVV